MSRLESFPGQRPRAIRSRTLQTLRWAAAAGQLAALLGSTLLLGVAPPLTPALALIAALALSNLALMRLRPGVARLSDREAAVWLLGDLLQLTLLLGVTGGMANPFAALLAAPVAVAASTLRLRLIAAVALAALAAATGLLFCAAPLPLSDGGVIAPAPLLLLGLWAAVCVTVLFTAAYVHTVSRDAARLSEALAAARLALAREQRVAAIGALAAAAAHELGTPLGTIRLIAGELSRTLGDHPDAAEDLALLRAEAKRCGAILQGLSRRGESDAFTGEAPIFALVLEAAAPHLEGSSAPALRLNGAPAEVNDPRQPIIARSPELIHALRNLLQNAAAHARSRVTVEVETDAARIALSVRDDGPGFPPELLARLGEPFVSTGGRGGGLGLGLFISRELMTRIGAELTFNNPEDGGALVRAVWRQHRVAAEQQV